MKAAWIFVDLSLSLGEWKNEWDTLNQRLNAGHPMLDSRFVDLLLKYFGSGKERLCVHRDSITSAIDAMLILEPVGIGRWQSFCPSQAQISPTLVKEGILLQDLLSALSAWTVDLLCLDPDYQLMSIPENLLYRVLDHAVTINIDTSGKYNDYWQDRSKSLRKNHNRNLRKLSDDNLTFSLKKIIDSESQKTAVKDYGKLELSGWKGREGTAVGVDDTQNDFYGELLFEFAKTNQSEIYKYFLNGELVASRLCIKSSGMIIILKTGFDESYSDYAPGKMLLNEVIVDQFNSGVGVLEFYTNASVDQLSWATSSRIIRHISLYKYNILCVLKDMSHYVRLWQKNWFAKGPYLPLARAEKPHFVHKLDELSDSFTKLLTAQENEALDQGEEWYRLLQTTVFTNHEEVLYVGLEQGGNAQLLLPLRWQGSGRRDLHSLSNYYTWLYAPPASKRVTDALYARLFGCLLETSESYQPPATLCLSPMDPQSEGFLRIERGLRRAGWLSFRFFCFGNWYLDVAGLSWADYLASRPGEVRSTIKRKGKKFAAAGGTLEILASENQLEEAIAAYQQIYAASWKHAEPYPEFIPGLIRTAAQRGWLRLGIARLAGQPVAAQIWLVAHGKAYIFKLAYDEKYSEYSSGTLLTALLMERVIAVDQVASVDFLCGDDPYKPQWMNARRERWGLIAYNPGTWRGLSGFLQEAGKRVAKACASILSGLPGLKARH